MENGELEEAQSHLMEALSIESDNTKIMSNLGFLELKMGNTLQAQKYFETVLEIDANDVLAKQALEQLNA